jgi:S-adenosylmethionine decarboxylase
MARDLVLAALRPAGRAVTRVFPPNGRHWLAEFYDARGLADARLVRSALRRAVGAAGLTLLEIKLHRFGRGRGITGVALLAESHISIHTWPESGYAALDLFICGRESDPSKALAALEDVLKPRAIRVRRFRRGMGLVNLTTKDRAL